MVYKFIHFMPAIGPLRARAPIGAAARCHT
jgi:hypothetical protein